MKETGSCLVATEGSYTRAGLPHWGYWPWPTRPNYCFSLTDKLSSVFDFPSYSYMQMFVYKPSKQKTCRVTWVTVEHRAQCNIRCCFIRISCKGMAPWLKTFKLIARATILFKYSCCFSFVRSCSILFSSSQCKNLCAWIYWTSPQGFKFTSLVQ
jgi:hypothetical protein